ncbi:MAG TPA: hypothetical protein DCM62_02750 [Bacteroidales bacterium]|nr:hypothetical protein [Bacteroidales bacterium]
MKWIILFVMLTIPFATHAGNRQVFGYSVRSGSQISISGSSNVSQFVCKTTKESPSGSFLLEDIGDRNRVLRFHDADLHLNVASFDCGNRIMNRNFQIAMGGDDSPYIYIRILRAESIRHNATTGNGTARVVVEITMNGQSRQSTMVVNYQSQDVNNIAVNTAKKMRMSDFGVDPPTPAFGLVRVNDEVTINLNLRIETGLLGVR